MKKFKQAKKDDPLVIDSLQQNRQFSTERKSAADDRNEMNPNEYTGDEQRNDNEDRENVQIDTNVNQFNALEMKSLLPIHAKLFEKHRIEDMRVLLKNMLLQQVIMHAKALESYSQLFECVCALNENS